MPKFISLDGGNQMAELHRTPPRHCHRQVREVAQGIAGAAWEMLATDNTFYKIWPKPGPYIRQKWGLFVDDARRSMGEMLGRSDVDEATKLRVYEALQMDGAAKGGDIQVVTH